MGQPATYHVGLSQAVECGCCCCEVRFCSGMVNEKDTRKAQVQEQISYAELGENVLIAFSEELVSVSPT